MQAKVGHFPLSAPKALTLIREIAKDSARIYFTGHAEKRMRKRNVSRLQVMQCLLKGSIDEGPALSTKGNWECRMQWIVAGQHISVAVAIDADHKGNRILVITVFTAS